MGVGLLRIVRTVSGYGVQANFEREAVRPFSWKICAGHKAPAAGRREMINIMFAHADRMGFFIEENHETKETK